MNALICSFPLSGIAANKDLHKHWQQGTMPSHHPCAKSYQALMRV